MSSPNQLSFLPDDYLEGKARRRANLLCAALFAVVMGAICAAFWITERSNAKAESDLRQVTDEYVKEAEFIKQAQLVQEKQRKMSHQAELTASLLEKVPRSNVLAEITNALPVGVSLLDVGMESRVRARPIAPAATAFEQKKAELDGKKAGPAPMEPRLYDVTLKVTGIATTDVQVSQLMGRLARSPLFTDVNLIITDEHKLRERNDAMMRKFQIEMSLNPGAEVSSPAGGTSAAVEK